MKKHKVEIPEGYEVERTLTCNSHNADNSPRIYKEVIFKPIEKQLPKTWEEFLHNNRNIAEIKAFEILMPSKDINSFRAFIRLIQLRDDYNDGWEPDWTDGNQAKFVIEFAKEVAYVEPDNFYRHPLTLKNNRLARKFLSNFRELIKTAKPLL